MLNDANKKTPKNANNFNCDFCHFKCSKNSEWVRHKMTLKHLNANKCYINANNFAPKNATPYICTVCNSEFAHQSSLSRHKKRHIEKTETQLINNIPNHESPQLINLITDLVKSNTELQSSILEICKNGKNVISTNSNNIINSNNKTFNLNVFLNETCKDAMNIMDFVDSLKLQLSDLERVGDIGYVNGISDIIIKNLKVMDIHKRPVHCTDTKREVIYVKDENKWEKENENKKMRNVIKHVAQKNAKLLNVFKEKYPDCGKSDSRQSDRYNKLIIEAMGGAGEDDVEKENKIIKKISKEVIINKNICY